MDEPWKRLRLAIIDVLEPLWYEFAKEGKESAVLAPLAQYPKAAAWLARSMAVGDNYINRKLAAMLAGWIHDSKHSGLLSEMLDSERKVFLKESLIANSVGEDIMFAATRWTVSQNLPVRLAGIDVLASMIRDALAGVHWNTVHWAVANLHHATDGKHEIFPELANATEAQLEGQRFLQNVVRALKQNDKQTFDRFVTAPTQLHALPINDPHYSIVSRLWNAAATAETAGN